MAGLAGVCGLPYISCSNVCHASAFDLMLSHGWHHPPRPPAKPEILLRSPTTVKDMQLEETATTGCQLERPETLSPFVNTSLAETLNSIP